LLRGTLQLMGAKPRHSERVARKAFLILQQRAALPPGEPLSLAARLVAAPGGRAGVALARPEFDRLLLDCLDAPELRPAAATAAAAAEQLGAEGLQPEAANGVAAERQSQTGGQERQQMEAAGQQDAQWQQQDVQQPAQEQQQQQPQPAFTLEDLHVACSLREQRSSVAVLLCGTSGTGKSTLAALLAARLGISTVVSTDSIRHMMRSFSSETEDPLLWASTYQAGAHLQQLAAAQAAQATAQAAAQAAQAAAQAASQAGQGAAAAAAGALAAAPPAAGAAASSADAQIAGGLPPRPPQLALPRAGAPLQPSTQRYASLPVAGMDARKAAVRGYKAQAARVLEHVDRLLTGCEARRQSVVVEGVHLSLSMVVRMMQRHPSVVPFLVHISNEAKHMERFAVRSKVMTLRPDGNRYVKHFRNIRAIQDYLAKSADKHAIPKVDNTNVDRSVATIHATLLGCLRRTARGEAVLAGGPSLTCKLLLEEYLRCQSATWSGRDMLELIRRKSAAGEAPSPSDLESTAATATAAASTPRGPLSEAAAEELHANGSVKRSATPPLLRSGAVSREGRPGQAGGHSRQQQQSGQQQDQQQQPQQQQREEEDEGDNRSFYGSDSQVCALPAWRCFRCFVAERCSVPERCCLPPLLTTDWAWLTGPPTTPTPAHLLGPPAIQQRGRHQPLLL
jgi:2-phosphoglycerate kinase